MFGFTKVIFILGGGPKIGASLAQKFAQEGYKVAIAARSAADGLSPEGYLNVKLDLSKPHLVKGAFEKVTSTFGVPPSVVAYNAYGHHYDTDPLGLSLDEMILSLNTNIASAYAAAQLSVASLDKLGPDGLTYIFTGNALSFPGFRDTNLMCLGVGKSGAAHFVELAALHYGSRGARFYYADERTDEGAPSYGGTDGPAHAKLYFDLAQKKEQGECLITFTKEKGITKF
ncbi:hypothetical protein MNV49_002794 [Pseudohyphozyma bogoriensis]|nr:hypothetical protein MNV49_002794 [Pseudohyphozyma bogoriensis]